MIKAIADVAILDVIEHAAQPGSAWAALPAGLGS